MAPGRAAAGVLIGLLATMGRASIDGFVDRFGGTPFRDERHPRGVQSIPGRVECALYDRGGEGVAYHDADAKNHGSGELNPADGTYLNQFRMDEGVDTSDTKFHRTPELIDDNGFEAVTPPENQLYVGWTEPGGDRGGPGVDHPVPAASRHPESRGAGLPLRPLRHASRQGHIGTADAGLALRN
jgi:hypothetical protein